MTQVDSFFCFGNIAAYKDKLKFALDLIKEIAVLEKALKGYFSEA